MEMSEKIKIGDSVKVKKGIKDPDLKKYDMTDWQGRVQSFDNDDETGELLILIQWDSITLKHLPDKFVTNSETEGCEFSEMVLGVSDVLKTVERDTISDVQQMKEVIEAAHYWDNFGKQGKRIVSVISKCENGSDLFDTWIEHLENNVELPCNVFYNGDSTKALRCGAEIIWDSIVDSDEHYGVIGCGKFNDKIIHFPLCDIEPVKITPKNQALLDYTVWFTNF